MLYQQLLPCLRAVSKLTTATDRCQSLWLCTETSAWDKHQQSQGLTVDLRPWLVMHVARPALSLHAAPTKWSMQALH